MWLRLGVRFEGADCKGDPAGPTFRVNRSYTHDLLALLGVAELEDELRRATRADKALQGNSETVRGWTEKSRYLSPAPKTRAAWSVR